MKNSIHVCLCFVVACIANCTGTTFAQDTYPLPAAKTASLKQGTQVAPAVQPAGGAGFNTGPVMPTGLSVPAHAKNRPQFASGDKQVRINVRYIMLDNATRAAMYERLGHQNLKTFGSKVPITDVELGDDVNASGSEVVGKSSHITTCILENTDVAEILKDVSASVGSNLSRAPSVILVDGQNANVTDLVQRPFLVDLKRQDTAQGAVLNTVTQVLDEGTSIKLKAQIKPPGRIDLSSELRISKLMGVEMQQIFGVYPKTTKVQVPVHQQVVAQVNENLAVGQSLLIDPYVKHETLITVDADVPVLSGVPYVKKLFKNKSGAKVQQNFIVLLEPMIEKPKQSSSQTQQ